MRLSHPMTHGAVTNWADMEALWSHVYSDDNLGVNPHSHPVCRSCYDAPPPPCTCLLKPQPHDGCLFQVLLTEPALSAKLSREKTAEVFFEHLSVPALYFSPQVGVPQWLGSGGGGQSRQLLTPNNTRRPSCNSLCCHCMPLVAPQG